MMKLIVCVDSRGGMAFRSRRVSRDRVVCDRILKLCDGELWIAPYSRPLFPVETDLRVSEKFLEQAGRSDWCFVETEDLRPWLNKAEQLVLFCWNRVYPSDVQFPLDQLKQEWECTEREDFFGYSHERITMEVYQRCRKNG